MTDIYRAPQRTLDGIRRYVNDRIPPGHFLTAVLSNDLRGAFSRADDENRAAMFAIVSYCYNEIPGACWGSPEAVGEWLDGIESGASE